MEISFVRKQLLAAIERARRTSRERRQRVAEIEGAYETFLQGVATPVIRMLAASLKAEGLFFSVSTPGGCVRLASDKTRDDFIELFLDTASDPPAVMARIGRSRGSRILTEERPLAPHAAPQAISEEDVLAFLLTALEPWLER